MSDIPQTKAASELQVENHAGGFSFKVTPRVQLQRFFLLGSEKGTYYAQGTPLKRDGQAWLEALVQSHGQMVLDEVVDFSTRGRSAKQDQLIFTLALLARLAPLDVRKKTFENLPACCRIPTTLFQFIELSQEMVPGSTGWGRMMRKAMETWYKGKPGKKLAIAVTKYANRNGWTHLDVLRKAHINPAGLSVAQQVVLKYVVKGAAALEEYAQSEDQEVQRTVAFLKAVEAAKSATEEAQIVALIRDSGLVREHIPNNWFSSVAVWEALLVDMPMTAMIRNLNKLTSVGVIAPDSPHLAQVIGKLTDPALLKAALVHPLNLFVAMKTYGSGHGDKGSLTWKPVEAITSALEEAFYLAFDQVGATGKRFLLALDVSGSMSGCSIKGLNISCREASAVMSMVTARTESNSRFMAFGNTFVPLNVNARMKLHEVIDNISNLPFGSTDCALPMTWAADQWRAAPPNRKDQVGVDTFIVYTDNETYFGSVHPHIALQQYRALTGIPARLIVCAMALNQFTIADPTDSGMLDIAGFDTAAPDVIREFSLGNI